MPITMNNGQRSCPFCDANDSFVEMIDGASYAVICNCCQARGPLTERIELPEGTLDDDLRASEAAAFTAWDARA